jgi:hypothetical protein
MEIDLYSPASVQYGDWSGSFSGDEVDMVRVEQFLGIDRDVWRLLHIGLTIYGGRQTIEPYAISANTTYLDLESTVSSGNAIQLTRLNSLEYEPFEHFDTNPPPPMSIPVLSATEFLGYGFKRLELKNNITQYPRRSKI